MRKDELAYSANHAYREGYEDGKADGAFAFAELLKMSYDKGQRLTMARSKSDTEAKKAQDVYSKLIKAVDDVLATFEVLEQMEK